MEGLETGSFVRGPLPLEWPEQIRLVSWNVNRGLQLEGIIEFLAGQRADLILLQETDINARRTLYRNIPREIARALQMNYVFGREFEELGQGSRKCPAFHGQTTLSRLPLSNPRILQFRRQSTFWRPRWFIPCFQIFQRRLGARMALVSEVTLQSRTLVLYNVHLESRGKSELRYGQLSEMLTWIGRDSAEKLSIVGGGDFNFDISRGSSAVLVGSTQLNSPFAQLGAVPTARSYRHPKGIAIDWVLSSKALCACNPVIHNSVVASDHYPLTLTLDLINSRGESRCQAL